MNGVFWIGICLGGIVSLIAAELTDLASWAAPRVVRSAARRLQSAELIERYSEEWQAELNAYEGLKLVKLFKALSIFSASARLRRELQSANANSRPSDVFGMIRDAARIALKAPLHCSEGTLPAHAVAFFCIRAGVTPTVLLLGSLDIVDDKVSCPKPSMMVRAFTALLHRPLGGVLLPTFCVIYAIRHRIPPGEFLSAWRSQKDIAKRAAKVYSAFRSAHGSTDGLTSLRVLLTELRSGWSDILRRLPTFFFGLPPGAGGQ